MSDESPVVSVIIPIYNCARYLPEAIDSVLAQTYRAFEIIVVDDGSTDNTQEVLAPYGDQIRVIRQANAGRGAARNAGILAARGDYIAFLDADDLWLPQKLEKQMALFGSRPEADWVYSDYRPFGQVSARVGSRLQMLESQPPPEGAILRRVLADWSITWTGTVLVRAECFGEIGLFDTSLPVAQDGDMWLRIASRFQAACANEVLALYRRHDSQAMSACPTDFVVYHTWRVYRKFMRSEYRRLPAVLRRQIGSVARAREAGLACQLGQLSLAKGERWAAQRWFLSALVTALGDPLRRNELAPWLMGQLLDTLLPQGVMRLARQVKRGAARVARAVREATGTRAYPRSSGQQK